MDKEWITTATETAHENAIKRDVYGHNPELAIIQKLKEEVLELQEAFLKNRKAELWLYHGERMVDNSIDVFERFVKNSIEDELADIIIVCLAASKELGIDISSHIQLKNSYNKKRSI